MRKADEKDREYRRVILMCAASCQGGHSDAGRAAAELLNIAFPITMDGLKWAAERDGFNPAEVWPWCYGPNGMATRRAKENADV
jgi:hypothetical protein